MSVEFEPDTINVKGLHQLLKALKQKAPEARLGILGSRTNRKLNEYGKATPTNATIGAAHEYGSLKRGLPQRSFLRVPVADHLQSEMDKAGAFSKEEAAEVIKKGTVVPWLRKVAVLAQGIVLQGFATGGYGKWPKWKTPGYQNRTGMLLIDTTQLRDSITHEVKE